LIRIDFPIWVTSGQKLSTTCSVSIVCTGSADETLRARGAVFVVPIPLGGAGLLSSPRVHFHMGTPAFRNNAGVAAEFGSHASAPIATHSQQMLRYSFRSLCAGQQRPGYSPPSYRGRWSRPRGCPADAQSGTEKNGSRGSLVFVLLSNCPRTAHNQIVTDRETS
jgi:hypothetical protein